MNIINKKFLDKSPFKTIYKNFIFNFQLYFNLGSELEYIATNKINLVINRVYNIQFIVKEELNEYNK